MCVCVWGCVPACGAVKGCQPPGKLTRQPISLSASQCVWGVCVCVLQCIASSLAVRQRSQEKQGGVCSRLIHHLPSHQSQPCLEDATRMTRVPLHMAVPHGALNITEVKPFTCSITMVTGMYTVDGSDSKRHTHTLHTHTSHSTPPYTHTSHIHNPNTTHRYQHGRVRHEYFKLYRLGL